MRPRLAWGAVWALLVSYGSMATRWIRDLLARVDDGIIIHLDAAELDATDAEVAEVGASDLLWIRESAVPPPLPEGAARPRPANFEEPDVRAFELG